MFAIIKRNIGEILLCLCGFSILAIFPGSITGLHFDEAWTFFRCMSIAEGYHFINGMNGYTGAIHQYLMFPFFTIFGYYTETIRIVSAVMNTFSLFFLIATVRIIHPGKKYHILFGLATITFPFYAIFARFSVELTSINFLLTTAGIFTITKAIFAIDEKKERFFSSMAGLCFGLAAYNHIISIVFPFALGISLIIFYRKKISENKRLIIFVLSSFIIGFLPRIISFFAIKENSPLLLNYYTLIEAVKDMKHLPGILIEMLDGSLVFTRFTGENFLPVFPYFSYALLALLWIKSVFISIRLSRLDKTVLLCLLILIIITAVISPRFSLRYFLIPVLFAPYLLVMFASRFFESENTFLRCFAFAVIALVVILNTFYLTCNYFISFSLSGGKLYTFPIGTRLFEKSGHFIRTKKLYRELVSKGVKIIYGDISIISPLLVHDIKKRNLEIITEDVLKTNAVFVKKTAVIYHPPVNMSDIIYYRQRNVSEKLVSYKRDRSFDSRFAVFVLDKDFDNGK